MVAPISVNITAVDNATKVLKTINAQMERMQAPAKKAQQEFERFTRLSGMDKLDQGLSKVRASATSAFRSMAQITPVLGAITSSVTIAGMNRLATNWANFGGQLQATSARLGMSSSELQKWQGAARLSGVSAETLTSGMTALQDGMWDAAGGRNPQMIAAFNTLGIALRNADGSARKASEVMPELADKIKDIHNPTARAAVATQFFKNAGEQMLPFLIRGSAGMEQYRREAEKYGIINEKGIYGAGRLQKAQAALTLSVNGFGNAVAQAVEPVITPVIQGMADWIAKNREWVAQNIAGYVKELGTWIGSINWQQVKAGLQGVWDGIQQFTQKVQDCINQMGGFKTVLEVVAGVLAFKVASSVLGTVGPLVSFAMTIARVVVPALFSLLAAMGPVGWAIAAGVAVIGGATYLIYKNWDAVKPYWDSLWGGIKKATDIAIKYILPVISPFANLGIELVKNWDTVGPFFKNLLSGIKDYFYNAFAYIRGIIEKILWAVGKVGGAIGITKAAAEETSKVLNSDPITAPNAPQIQAANDNVIKSGPSMVGNILSKINPFNNLSNVANNNTQKVDNIHNNVKGLTNNNTLNGYIQKATQGSGVTEAQLKALIATESSGRMVGNAESSAFGYTQLTNAAAKDVGVNKYDPYQNVVGGRKYYEQALKKINGNPLAAYGAYHDGKNSAGANNFLKTGNLSLFSPAARQAMVVFQKNLNQTNGGISAFNQAIPSSISAPMTASRNAVNGVIKPSGGQVVSFAKPLTLDSGLGQLSGGNSLSIPSAPAVSMPPPARSDSNAQRLFLEIDIKNQPQGMSVKPKSKSSSLTVESVSYQRAMDPIQSAGGF